MFPTFSFHHSYLKGILVQDILSYLEKKSILLQNMYVSFSYLIRTVFFGFFLRIFQFASWQYKQQFVPCHIYLPTFFPSQPQVKVRKKKGNFFMGSKKQKKGLCLPVFIWSQWYWLQEGLIVFHFDNTWSVQIDFCKEEKMALQYLDAYM